MECKRKVLAHREGRTRSLQMTVGCNHHPPKSLTLYPIELGGRWRYDEKVAVVAVSFSN